MMLVSGLKEIYEIGWRDIVVDNYDCKIKKYRLDGEVKAYPLYRNISLIERRSSLNADSVEE